MEIRLKTKERTRSMITNQALINQSKSGSGQEPTNKQRRALIGGALVALLSSPRRGMAGGKAVSPDTFLLLPKGGLQHGGPRTGAHPRLFPTRGEPKDCLSSQ